MRIIVAPLAFKGTASATVGAAAMRRGALRVAPSAEVVVIPMADGGEGTVEALVTATGGRFVEADAHDPLNRPLKARWGILGDGSTAAIEVAAASGLALLQPRERDATRTTTFGTGELIRAALEGGFHRILVGLGDSATNDAGAGVASALGIRLIGRRGEELPKGGGALAGLAHVDLSQKHPLLSAAAIIGLCDVNNPLCGPLGAATVYGPQKGATPREIHRLDAALEHFAAAVEHQFGRAVRDLPGAGAAGGLGAGLVALCGAALQPGFTVVGEALELPRHLADADLVLTGEGRIDAQTAFGKGVGRVAALAKEYGIPCVAVVGKSGLEPKTAEAMGITAIFSLAPNAESIADLAATTPSRIEQTTADALSQVLMQ